VLKYSYGWTDNRIKYSSNWLNRPPAHNAAYIWHCINLAWHALTIIDKDMLHVFYRFLLGLSSIAISQSMKLKASINISLKSIRRIEREPQEAIKTNRLFWLYDTHWVESIGNWSTLQTRLTQYFRSNRFYWSTNWNSSDWNQSPTNFKKPEIFLVCLDASTLFQECWLPSLTHQRHIAV